MPSARISDLSTSFLCSLEKLLTGTLLLYAPEWDCMPAYVKEWKEFAINVLHAFWCGVIKHQALTQQLRSMETVKKKKKKEKKIDVS